MFIKRPTGSAALKGQAWRRTERVCLHVNADWREREREGAARQECACAHVPHETTRSNLSLERESERERVGEGRRRRSERMMVLCAADEKVSGLSPSLDQNGEDGSWRWAARHNSVCWRPFGADGGVSVFLSWQKKKKKV